MIASGMPARRFYAAYLAYGRMRLGLQLVLGLLLVLPPIWGFVGFEILRMRAAAEQAAEAEVANLSHALAKEVGATINTIDLSLIGLRERWTSKRSGFGKIVQQLQQHVDATVLFQVSITDARGRLVYSNVDPRSAGMDLSDREHIRVHLDNPQDKLFISKALMGRVSRQWSVQFTRPVYDADGRLDGVVVASVAPAYFVRFLDEVSLGEDASVALIGQGGEVLARNVAGAPDLGIGQQLGDPRFERPGRVESGNYRRVSRIDGIERIYAWRTLPRYNLTVLLGESVKAMEARYAAQQRAFLLGGLAATLLVAGAGWLLLLAARYRMQAVDALEESEARWKFALEGAGDGVWDWDLATGGLALSERARDILRLHGTQTAATFSMVEDAVHPDDLPAIRSALHKHLQDDAAAYVVEHRLAEAPGEPAAWVLARGMVVKRGRDGEPLRMVGTFSDISERKQRETLIEHMARHDPLTGLPNRTLLRDRLQQALLRARRDHAPLAVLYFDLDKFKPVNDTWGHATGDRLLVAVAERVRDCLRGSDTVARVGGDEFVVLLPALASEEDAAAIGENILAALNRPFEVDGHLLSISGSIGIATFPADGADEETLVRCADQAMYQAKDAGRGRVQMHLRA